MSREPRTYRASSSSRLLLYTLTLAGIAFVITLAADGLRHAIAVAITIFLIFGAFTFGRWGRL